MRNLKPISGRLKRELQNLGWTQLPVSRLWTHKDHPYKSCRLVGGFFGSVLGLTLRAAARRAGILPAGY